MDWRGRDVATFTYVNTSDEDGCKPFDSRFYEVAMQLEGLETDPFELETLEESFRFDRRVPGYGINCGLRANAGRFITVDTPAYDRQRPVYWGAESVPPPLDFVSLSRDPLPAARELARAHSEWGARNWDKAILEKRASTEGWADEMLGAAMTAVDEFREENLRIARGVELLATNERLARAFRLMNESMAIVGARKGYDSWRPFQFGFLLANLASLMDTAKEPDIVDIVWFATGGGKTETYLGLLITAAFSDRLSGKKAGVTAWSRFPLRLLSLQQMQRFADAMAAAELVRRRHSIDGAGFSVGFLVGDDSTPNKWRRKDQDRNARYDPDEKPLIDRFRMLQACPFCGNPDLKMAELIDLGRVITGGNRERDLRTGFSIPFKLTLGGMLEFARRPRWGINYMTHGRFRLPQLDEHVDMGGGAMSIGRYFTEMLDPSMNWGDVTEMVRFWGGQFCLKGVMSVDDAKRAAEIGCTGAMNRGRRRGRPMAGAAVALQYKAYDELGSVNFHALQIASRGLASSSLSRDAWCIAASSRIPVTLPQAGPGFSNFDGTSHA
jgi:FMN-dependent dehydrogenase